MIARFDHLVLTVRDVPRTIRFYTDVLGLTAVRFGDDRWALTFGQQKINLHQHGREFLPKAHQPTPGSADLCFVSAWPLAQVVQRLRSLDIPIEQGPVPRMGALGPVTSIYLRDPDENLLEISTYDQPTGTN